MTSNILIGRIIGADAGKIQFSCSEALMGQAKIGSLVVAVPQSGTPCYGVIGNIRWIGDDLINQLARSDGAAIDQGVLLDNQIQRVNGPIIDVQIVGYRQIGFVHSLPFQPPISLEKILLCDPEEIYQFARHSFSYLRFVLDSDLPNKLQVLAAHLELVTTVEQTYGDVGWVRRAMQYLTGVLLADYETLVALAESVAQRIPDHYFAEE